MGPMWTKKRGRSGARRRLKLAAGAAAVHRNRPWPRQDQPHRRVRAKDGQKRMPQGRLVRNTRTGQILHTMHAARISAREEAPPRSRLLLGLHLRVARDPLFCLRGHICSIRVTTPPRHAPPDAAPLPSRRPQLAARPPAIARLPAPLYRADCVAAAFGLAQKAYAVSLPRRPRTTTTSSEPSLLRSGDLAANSTAQVDRGVAQPRIRRPGFGRNRSSLARAGPNLVEFAPTSVELADVWQTSAPKLPNSSESQARSPICGRVLWMGFHSLVTGP